MKTPEHFAAVDPRKPSKSETASGRSDKDILAGYDGAQQQEILRKQQLLSSLGYFIGKDFEMPILLNEPGAGWHWNFAENHVRIDPDDLLLEKFNEKRKAAGMAEVPPAEHLDYLRFVIQHEGGHRRISRTDFIPEDVWKQPGFSFMMNAIEDPRDNNFVAEAYPKFREHMNLAYSLDQQFEQEAKELAKKKLGTVPKFLQAGHEYIKQWFKEVTGKPFEIDKTLPKAVQEVVKKTLTATQDSWWRYPSKDEADESEELIRRYAESSYRINLEKVWPEFKKLVEEDMKDQKTKEMLDGMQKGKGQPGQGEGQPKEGSGQGIPKELQDNLTPGQQKELEGAIQQALDGNGKPTPIDPKSLSPELRKKLEEFFDSLPEEKKRELVEKARQALKEYEDEINKALEGKLMGTLKPESKPSDPERGAWIEGEMLADDARREMRKRMEDSLDRSSDRPSEKALNEVAPFVDALTGDLRDVFLKRKMTTTEAGYRSGRRWNIRTRIKEKIAGVPLLKTHSREEPESPSEEKDYAITLMLDCSGSMSRGNKIWEAFKSLIMLAETLNNLGIRFEIVGFQDILLEFKRFDEEWNDEMRVKLEQMLKEVENRNPGGHNKAGDNDDGACLLEASRRLAQEQAREKMLIPLSDGIPAMDSGRKSQSQLDRELKDAVREISQNSGQKLIGVGINSSAVSRYYENSLPDVDAKELAETLGELLRAVIERE